MEKSKSNYSVIVSNIKSGYNFLPPAVYSDAGGSICRYEKDKVRVLVCVAYVEQGSICNMSPDDQEHYCSEIINQYIKHLLECYSINKGIPYDAFVHSMLKTDDGSIYLFEEIREETLYAYQDRRKEGPKPRSPWKSVIIALLTCLVLCSGYFIFCKLKPSSGGGKGRTLEGDVQIPDPLSDEPETPVDVYEEPENVRLQGIQVKELPAKTTQYVGEKTSTAGLTIELLYSNESKETVTDGFIVTPQHLETAGKQEITVQYSDCTTAYSINVLEVEVDSIAVSARPSKTTYYIGEAFQANGLELKATYNNGEIKKVSRTGDMSFAPDTFSSAGEQNVTITYEGVSTTSKVTVYGASKILEDNDQKGKTESEARRALGKYSVNISVEYEAADGDHIGKVLSCRATSEQNITLVVGEKTDFTIKEKNGSITITGISKSTDFLNIPDRINGLPVTEIADYAFEKSPSDDMGLRKVSFPSGLVRIGEGAFSECAFLEEVILPDTVEELGPGAFWCCSAVKSLSLGKVKKIGEYAFQYCMNITQIDIPDTCTSIGDEAFSGVMAAKRINLPASLTYIGGGAFTDCIRAEVHAAPGSYAEKYLAESDMGG